MKFCRMKVEYQMTDVLSLFHIWQNTMAVRGLLVSVNLRGDLDTVQFNPAIFFFGKNMQKSLTFSKINSAML